MNLLVNAGSSGFIAFPGTEIQLECDVAELRVDSSSWKQMLTLFPSIYIYLCVSLSWTKSKCKEIKLDCLLRRMAKYPMNDEMMLMSIAVIANCWMLRDDDEKWEVRE